MTASLSAPEVAAVPDPEVNDKPKRRKFTASYKLAILRELDACPRGGKGAILRREGLYTSQITQWRKDREDGVLNALAPRKRGRPRKVKNPLQDEHTALQRENARLKRELEKAHTIIDVQKKLSVLLGIDMPATENEE